MATLIGASDSIELYDITDKCDCQPFRLTPSIACPTISLMPDDPCTLSPEEVDALEGQAFYPHHNLIASLFATVRDRERQRDEAIHTIRELRAINVKEGVSLGLVEELQRQLDELHLAIDPNHDGKVDHAGFLAEARDGADALDKLAGIVALERQLAEARKDTERLHEALHKTGRCPIEGCQGYYRRRKGGRA